MINGINLYLILSAAFLATASPGPSTLAIAGTSMNSGRPYGIAVASGILTGSLTWSVSAALGLSALMLTNAWIFETMRYFSAAYLLYLAYKSARSALTPSSNLHQTFVTPSYKSAYLKGLMLHLTNPKAILFFGSLYSIGIPAGTSFSSLLIVIGAIWIQSFIIFNGYALLFSNKNIVAGYVKLKRYFEAVFALAFGAAAFKIFTSKI